MKKLIYIVIAFAVVLGGWYYVSQKQTELLPTPASTRPDMQNATFTIDGKSITLAGGVAQTEAAPGSASKVITRFFGNESIGDLNDDGLMDTAFLVTQETGGSGTFFYAVVALRNPNGGYTYTNGFLIGDRIAPQPTEINQSAGELYVNYAERKPGEPMTAQPSVGATKILVVTPDGVLKGLMQ